VIRFIRDELRHPGGRAHAFDARDAAGAFLRSVHAARIELHDPLGVGQAAPADAGLIRIELDDADAGDEGAVFSDEVVEPLPSLDLEFGDVVPVPPPVVNVLSTLLGGL
jgi:hypothetical protein